MTRERQDGTKRSEILAAATQRFGRDGYEHTKWADVAADVGVGPTALYHYFESKQHCLYVIMEEAVEDFQRRFSAITSQTPDPLQALTAVLYDCFDLTEQDIMRNRVLVSEQGLLAVSRPSPREEEARRAARSRARELEFAWASLLAGAMRAGTSHIGAGHRNTSACDGRQTFSCVAAVDNRLAKITVQGDCADRFRRST